MYRKLVWVLVFLFAWISISSQVWAKDKYYLGVLAKRGKAKAVKKWSPLADYLSQETGYKIKLRPLSFKAIEPAVARKKIDFLIVNPQYYVYLKKYGATPIATLINIRQGKKLSSFGGVIIVRADSPIQKVQDLKGKKFMIVSWKSFGGAFMAFRYLCERGINPWKDLKVIVGKTHDNVVYAVLNGQVDAGTVRTDTLERMAAEGKINLSDLRVLEEKGNFAFLVTTELYPEWPFFAFPWTDKAVSTQVKKALLNLKPSDPAARAAKIAGWQEPLNYDPVFQCVKEVEACKNR